MKLRYDRGYYIHVSPQQDMHPRDDVADLIFYQAHIILSTCLRTPIAFWRRNMLWINNFLAIDSSLFQPRDVRHTRYIVLTPHSMMALWMLPFARSTKCLAHNTDGLIPLWRYQKSHVASNTMCAVGEANTVCTVVLWEKVRCRSRNDANFSESSNVTKCM